MRNFEMVAIASILLVLVLGVAALGQMPGIFFGGSDSTLRQQLFVTGLLLILVGKHVFDYVAAQIKSPPIYGGDLLAVGFVVFSADLCLVGAFFYPTGVIFWIPAINLGLFLATLLAQSRTWFIGKEKKAGGLRQYPLVLP